MLIEEKEGEQMATDPKSRALRKLRKRLAIEEADHLRVEAIAAPKRPRSGAPEREINHGSAAKCVEGAVGASTHEPTTYDLSGD